MDYHLAFDKGDHTSMIRVVCRCMEEEVDFHFVHEDDGKTVTMRFKDEVDLNRVAD